MTELSPAAQAVLDATGRTDFRALCAELLNRLNGLYEEIIDAGVGSIPNEAQDLMNRAWEAMAEPEPKGPTDEELLEEWRQLMGSPRAVLAQPMLDFARAVLARWGK